MQENERKAVELLETIPIYEREHKETIDHFGYSAEDMAGVPCFISTNKYGALFFLQLFPPVAKCRIIIEHNNVENEPIRKTVIDYDPDHPRSLTRFV